MKTTDNIRNEKGFILVLALVVMAAMTAIGLAIITSSTTDMLISRNETEAKKAFYLAEAGIQEALGRMRLAGNARYIGENSAQKIARINNADMSGGAGMYTGQSFTSSTLSTQSPNQLQNFNGTYTVTVNYALADGSSWCYGPATPFNNCDNRVLMYGQDFGFIGTGVPAKGYVPLYQIDSTGTTVSGASATVREYVTASTLNVIPPAGDVYSNTTSNPSIDIGGSGNMVGAISGDYVGGGCGAGCTSVPWPGPVDMNNYLGIPTAEIKQYADYMYNGGGVYNYTTWGTLCNANNTGNLNDHICDNPSALVYVDNAGSTTAEIHSNGRGILIITGDAKINSNVVWEGMVYIMGNLTGNGTVTCYGTIMVNSTINFTGNITDLGSVAIASSVANGISLPRELRWAKR